LKQENPKCIEGKMERVISRKDDDWGLIIQKMAKNFEGSMHLIKGVIKGTGGPNYASHC